MIDSIEIKNFKSIENLRIENLKNVNFFFGKANTAKTSVLEAIYLYLGRDTKKISYLGSLNHRATKENLNKLINSGELDTLNEYCRKFNDDISRIMISNNYIKVIENSKKVDLKFMGQGFQTYLSYISSILLKNRFICIDNIETGLHFEHIDLILKIILEQSIQNNIQFFITTHSKELLERLAKIVDENTDFKDKLACYNLYREDNTIKVCEHKVNGFIVNMEVGNEIRD